MKKTVLTNCTRLLEKVSHRETQKSLKYFQRCGLFIRLIYALSIVKVSAENDLRLPETVSIQTYMLFWDIKLSDFEWLGYICFQKSKVNIQLF